MYFYVEREKYFCCFQRRQSRCQYSLHVSVLPSLSSLLSPMLYFCFISTALPLYFHVFLCVRLVCFCSFRSSFFSRFFFKFFLLPWTNNNIAWLCVFVQVPNGIFFCHMFFAFLFTFSLSLSVSVSLIRKKDLCSLRHMHKICDLQRNPNYKHTKRKFTQQVVIHTEKGQIDIQHTSTQTNVCVCQCLSYFRQCTLPYVQREALCLATKVGKRIFQYY